MQSISFQTKVLFFQSKFEGLSPSKKFEEIISLGKSLPQISKENRREDNLVRGCQSELYLFAELKDGKIFFSAGAEALISAGLAALLISIYSGEDVDTIVSSPPHFLEMIGIHTSLSPSRSQGVSHIYLKMKLQSILLAKNELLLRDS